MASNEARRIVASIFRSVVVHGPESIGGRRVDSNEPEGLFAAGESVLERALRRLRTEGAFHYRHPRQPDSAIGVPPFGTTQEAEQHVRDSFPAGRDNLRQSSDSFALADMMPEMLRPKPGNESFFLGDIMPQFGPSPRSEQLLTPRRNPKALSRKKLHNPPTIPEPFPSTYPPREQSCRTWIQSFHHDFDINLLGRRMGTIGPITVSTGTDVSTAAAFGVTLGRALHALAKRFGMVPCWPEKQIKNWDRDISRGEFPEELLDDYVEIMKQLDPRYKPDPQSELQAVIEGAVLRMIAQIYSSSTKLSLCTDDCKTGADCYSGENLDSYTVQRVYENLVLEPTRKIRNIPDPNGGPSTQAEWEFEVICEIRMEVSVGFTLKCECLPPEDQGF